MVSRSPTGLDSVLANAVCLNFNSSRNVCNADVCKYVSMYERVHTHVHVYVSIAEHVWVVRSLDVIQRCNLGPAGRVFSGDWRGRGGRCGRSDHIEKHAHISSRIYGTRAVVRDRRASIAILGGAVGA